MVLGVTRGAAVELPEVLDVLKADRGRVPAVLLGDPGEVEHAVEEQRGVSGREHEAVAVGPVRIGRVVAQVAVPQGVGDRRQRHRRPRMPRVRLLDRIDRERPDGVDGEGLALAHGHDALLSRLDPVARRSVTRPRPAVRSPALPFESSAPVPRSLWGPSVRL